MSKEPRERVAEEAKPDLAFNPVLLKKVDELELSVRATNCLESEGITTVRDLVIRNDDELLEVRNFGETTLKEVKAKLSDRGLTLGMTVLSGALHIVLMQGLALVGLVVYFGLRRDCAPANREADYAWMAPAT